MANTDIPLIIIVVAIVFFYLKLAMMQWRRARKESKKAKNEMRQARKEGRQVAKPEKPVEKFAIQVRNWWVVGAALFLMIVPWALFSMNVTFLGDIIQFWWVPMAVGIIILAFAIN